MVTEVENRTGREGFVRNDIFNSNGERTVANPQISMLTVLAVLGWVLGVALVLLDLFWITADDLGHLGLLFAMGGAVLNVRLFACQLAGQMRGAFDLGREAGRLGLVPTQQHIRH